MHKPTVYAISFVDFKEKRIKLKTDYFRKGENLAFLSSVSN